jgi:nicotinamidase-related amidase
VIVEDATAELDEPSHDATLRQFAVRFGRVWTVEETLSVLGLSGAAPAMSPGSLRA